VNYKEQGVEKMKNRAERLLRLIALNAPAGILAREAVLIFKSAMMVSPEVTMEEIGLLLKTAIRSDVHRCVDCEAPVGWDEKYCDKCHEEISNPDDDDDDGTSNIEIV
jgi:adenylosuccinate synthase